MRPLLLGCLLALAVVAPAGAVTTTIDFDAHSPGDVITSESGATFEESPTVFDPQHVATHTEPYALHDAAACPNDLGGHTCSRTGHHLLHAQEPGLAARRPRRRAGRRRSSPSGPS